MRVAPLAAPLLLLPLLGAPPAHACSKRTLAPVLRGSEVFFTGTATPDTLLAGPGAVEYDMRGDRDGHTRAVSIHGQMFRVDRVGGPAADRLPEDVREVVVVPWDYDPGCGTLAWNAGVRWVPPGTHGFLVASLRAEEHWVDGRPTLDLHNPYNLPYTGTEHTWDMDGDAPLTSLLTPEQVFDLHQALPTVAQVAREKTRVLEPLRAWARAHPGLADRPPARLLLEGVVYVVARAELRETDHPVLGTWRFTLRLPGDSSYTFYARTRSHPTGRWTPSDVRTEREPGELRLSKDWGYTLRVSVAAELEDLPETVGSGGGYVQADFHAFARPDSSAGGEPSWRGWIESSILQAIPDDPRVRRAAAEMRERYKGVYRPRLSDETPARFFRGADGVLRVRQAFPLSGPEDLLLEGERVSRRVTRGPW